MNYGTHTNKRLLSLQCRIPDKFQTFPYSTVIDMLDWTLGCLVENIKGYTAYKVSKDMQDIISYISFAFEKYFLCFEKYFPLF